MLRPATLDDLPFVYESLCDLEETTLPYPAFERIYRDNLSNPAIRYVLSEVDNVPVGFASCHVQLLLHHAGPVAEIQELYVRPEYRSQGIGRQLIEHIMHIARQEEWVHLEVTSNRKRQRTHAFYEQLGLVWTSQKFVWKVAP
ncbi:GNAT family N-acetyltransferase [Fibrella sp. WM1]|uniref:GNAT family N-acetyltransferase n=1 Tax=Fibrella musci TaxID=3242485 RepID=UPI003522C486